jgi:hypothetical protein
MEFENQFNRTIIEPWFIPIDILLIISTTVSILLAFIYTSIIILKKTCHTVPMMLVANSCLAELVYGSNMLSMAVFTYQNDIKRIEYYDSLCICRGYLGYVVTVLQNYSYLLQAIYRFITVVYPTRLFWRSAKFQLFLIFSTWIFGFLCPIPYLVTNTITYNVNNQICQSPLRFSLLTVYNALSLYIIPISLIIFIYFKLVRHVQEMSKRITLVNILFHAERELKMVQQIVILVLGVVTIGLPYTIFVILSFFVNIPKYHFRIAYIFVDVGLTFVMIAIFKFTEPLKSFIIKQIIAQRNMIIPAFG